MIQLTPQHIQLHARATTKEEAIRAAGRVLIEAGAIEPAYIESMLGREQQANTFIGNGIAIPHGMGKDRELIRRTGVCVVQFPEGVEWNSGQIVRLLVGIAAKSDEHLEILAALTDVLENPETAEQFAHTSDPAEIIAVLNRPHDGASIAPADDLGAQYVNATLRPGAGLHARPATAFVAIAGKFSSEIRLEFNGKVAHGKAMSSLLKLGAPGGATLRLMARGLDAEEALAALKHAVESGLGDEEDQTVRTNTRAWVPLSKSISIAGICASPGLAIGRLHQFQTSLIIANDTSGDPFREVQRLHAAIEIAKRQLRDLYESTAVRAGKSESGIFRAHEAFLTDPELLGEVIALIDAGHGVGMSWQQAIEHRVVEIKRAADPRIAGRATDLYDVGQRVLSLLVQTERRDAALPDEPCILIAQDLTPSDTAQLDPQRIVGVVTVAGGPTSHTAIIARALGLPVIVGADAAVLELPEGIMGLLDATAGRLYTGLSSAALESARQFQIEVQCHGDEAHARRYQPALMIDGHRVEVVANIAAAASAAAAVDAGAEGVGLLRTEFLFLEREAPPTEEEQFEAYREMAGALDGLPLIIRTLDIGGDKVAPYLSLPKEGNPFLGVRGLRLCLRRPELFLPQLRAIYRTSLAGSVKILLPMVATLGELRTAKSMAEQVRSELGVPPIEIGIMVEVPATAMLAAEFAKECDFFSVGTNDLTQYTLAMDRGHPELASEVDGLHPAVLRLIDQSVRGAKSAGKWVGVCGGVASDPLGAMILVGLGVTELSVSIPSVATVKAHLRGTSLARAQTLARRALACISAAEVQTLAS